ncbi:hypothetical protein [Pseudomonas sp. CCOS 191]|uniref:hypothetical protein n=1 Tax=Pseudomonas sp. CCOS 191 TaxID=1649877 RepID=UPI0012E05241
MTDGSANSATFGPSCSPRVPILPPIEFWAARRIFGNRKNDGEVHPEIVLDHEKNFLHSLLCKKNLKPGTMSITDQG